MAIDLRVPSGENESKCQDCSHPATSVINGIPQCDEHAGKRILADFPEVFGMLLARSLRRE
jgi:hypothetical protein